MKTNTPKDMTRPATRSRLILAGVIVLVLVAGGAYAKRHSILDAWRSFRAPNLPSAQGYVPSQQVASGTGSQETTTPFEGGYSTSQNYVIETTPVQKPTTGGDPLAFTGTLPAEKNLDVPFTTQAPYANWDLPYQEACEEAASLMVDAYYRGKTGRMDPAEADAAIKQLVDYQNQTIGNYLDTTAQQTADFIKGSFGYKNVIVKPLTSPDDMKEAIALGYPVILPTAGKLLNNPNFKNGGPPYHMLVIRGYTDKVFITNDPGTRNGLEYTYSYDTLMNAAHDWMGKPELITQGAKVMIVVLPNE
jgi:hypothetical protein